MSKTTRLTDEWWADLVFGVVLLAAAYGFGSWAINTASMWAYLLTIISLVWAIRRLAKGIRYAFHR